MKYDINKASVLLSVRELCTLSLISGDLDCRRGSKQAWMEDARKASEVHRLLQNRGEDGYRAEVPLTNCTMFDGIVYEVSGRADGVVFLPESVTLEEIKTVSGRRTNMTPSLFQQTQALCYAHFLCTYHQLDKIIVRLTVCNIDSGEIESSEETFTAKYLLEFYRKILSSVSFPAKLLVERKTVRLPSVKTGKFPFASVREGQEIMMKECYRAIKRGNRLFIQAPTGTGKTISSLYPAVMALGDGYCEKVFYLTAKASTRKEAYRAAADIFSAGAHLRTIVLTAKEQLCPNAVAKEDPAGISAHCNPDDCPRARGFYDRLPAAIAGLLSKQSGYPRQTLEAVANEFSLCPYEFQLEVARFCDIIICDYNSVFDPIVYLRRFFGEDAVDRDMNVVLIDEAHNLADRACNMYSAELSLSTVKSVFDTASLPEKKCLEPLIHAMEGLRTLTAESKIADEAGVQHGFYLSKNPLERFAATVTESKHLIEKKVLSRAQDEPDAGWNALYRLLTKYETISTYYDERFLTFLEENGEDLTVRQICLDPSGVLSSIMSKLRATILFSATLTPTEYFADILGGGKKAERLSLPSPFDPNRLLVSVLTGISTRYEDRKKSCKPLVSALAASISGKPGNYIAYFPSYDYMEEVAKAFQKKYQNVPIVCQQRGMNIAKRETFLDAFADDGKLRLGFCVLGGSFAEGVDLPGKRLIGTIIVGVGLPGISSERNILKEYYDNTRERGYDYAYTYPGMNRVLQAAGRVIRTESDCGIVVLIDDRYATPAYQTLFPEHWTNVKYAGKSFELAEIVSSFWNNID